MEICVNNDLAATVYLILGLNAIFRSMFRPQDYWKQTVAT